MKHTCTDTHPHTQSSLLTDSTQITLTLNMLFTPAFDSNGNRLLSQFYNKSGVAVSLFKQYFHSLRAVFPEGCEHCVQNTAFLRKQIGASSFFHVDSI